MPRTPKAAKTAERREQAWALRVQNGMTEDDIAKELGIAQSTVSEDLAKVRADIQAEMADTVLDHHRTQIARLNRIYDAAMAAWEQSKMPKATLTEATEKWADGSRKVTKKQLVDRDPATKYLETALRALRDMRAIMGVETGLPVAARESKGSKGPKVLVLLPDNARGDRAAIPLDEADVVDVPASSFVAARMIEAGAGPEPGENGGSDA